VARGPIKLSHHKRASRRAPSLEVSRSPVKLTRSCAMRCGPEISAPIPALRRVHHDARFASSLVVSFKPSDHSRSHHPVLCLPLGDASHPCLPPRRGQVSAHRPLSANLPLLLAQIVPEPLLGQI
jgi:hypothetical protein